MSTERVTIPNEREERIIIDNSAAGENCKLVGILHRSPKNKSTQGRPLVLVSILPFFATLLFTDFSSRLQILHGILAHKNQSYHPLLAERLANERGLDSFRYDLRAQGGESDGEWGMANFEDDVDDIETVVDAMKIKFGYKVHCSEYAFLLRRFLSLYMFIVLIVNRFPSTEVIGHSRGKFNP